jgi:Cu(I)/Ag(I) efflux system membrane protein CusA/SilA
VLLAVPFALTGGLYLVWLLGYSFSVAVWVGFIALFGTAVQTGVVMVIYLEEAVARKRRELNGGMTRAALRDAVMEGALLRLRPKVMTVSTVVAGLLPIMWSTRVGAEVMKPLAAPVLGGMVSSLAGVLVVTPVLFFLIRERQLGRESIPASAPDAETAGAGRTETSRRAIRRLVAVLIVVALGLAAWWVTSRRQDSGATAGRIIETVRAGDLVVTVLSETGMLKQGRTTFAIEFRSASTNALVDIGDVRLSASMSMPGMVMPAATEIVPSGTAGRYVVTGEFGMPGAWRMTLEWNGPAGKGSVSFDGDVQ